MKEKSTKIVVEFKDIPMNLYHKKDDLRNPNLLVINIQPNEGITLHLNAKKTGNGNLTEPIQLAYHQDAQSGINTPEAYEKLIYDSMLGDATNFTHWDEVALSWEFVDRLLASWAKQKAEFPNYESGSMCQKLQTSYLKKMASAGGLNKTIQ